jgi:CheY-like chemotaxis protein
VQDDEYLVSNEDYERIISQFFGKFVLNLGLCSPRSLNLSRQQLITLFTELEKKLPPHLSQLPKLKITFQALDRKEDPKLGTVLNADLKVYTLHSDNVMAEYKSKISKSEIKLELVSERPEHIIRKKSLFGHSPSSSAIETTPEPENSNQPIIYIVDDEHLMHRALSAILKKLNPHFKIYCFSSGLEVCNNYLESNHSVSRPCALIFMDIQMLVMDGVEATKKIREFELSHKLSPVPIFALTAKAASDIEECGMTGYCQKPINRESVRKILVSVGLTVVAEQATIPMTPSPVFQHLQAVKLKQSNNGSEVADFQQSPAAPEADETTDDDNCFSSICRFF